MTINVNDVKNSPELKTLLNDLQKQPVWADLAEAGGDPYEVLAKYAPEAFKVHPSSANMRTKFVTRRFINELDILNARDNRGIILGTIDEAMDSAASKTRPTTYISLLSSGEVRKIASFDGNLVTKPGIYTLAVDYNADRGNYVARKRLEYEPITADVTPIFKKVAINTDSEEWDNFDYAEYPPVIVKGTISGIYAIPEYGVIRDEYGVENTKVIGSKQILSQNKRTPIPDVIPVMQVNLDSGNSDNRIEVKFPQTIYGKPYVGLEDFDNIAKYAYENFEDDPRAQANEISEAYKGEEVIIVGYIVRRRQAVSREGESYTQITVRGSAIFQTKYNTFAEIEEKEETPLEKIAKATGIDISNVKTANSTVEDAAETEEESTTENDKTEEENEEEEEEVVAPPKKSTKKTTKKTETLVVDAPVVEAPTGKKQKAQKIPAYEDDSEGFIDAVVFNGYWICRNLHQPVDKVTDEFLKGVIVGVDTSSVPMPIWKSIVKKIKAMLRADEEDDDDDEE